MDKLRYIFVVNAMLVGNYVANMVGVASVRTLYAVVEPAVPQVSLEVLETAVTYYNLFAFILSPLALIWYELPIRRSLRLIHLRKTIPAPLLAKARGRLLNEPFFLVLFDFAIWCLAAVTLSGVVLAAQGPLSMVGEIFFRALFTGMITAVAAFYVAEHIMQKRLSPRLFPQGGLHKTPKVLRVKIGVRMAAFVFAAGLVPFLAIFMTIRGSVMALRLNMLPPQEILERLQLLLGWEALIFMVSAALLTWLMSTNITRPLREMVRVLHEVQNGIFKRKVKVTTNDEIGYAGDAINEMVDGLKERDFIKETFGKYVTQEVRDEILKGRIPLDGEQKEVTVLFADLRGFTPMVEATPPKEVIEIINGYFAEMAEAISGNQGLVLQYIGDEIEAVFGAPLALSDHSDKALRAALEMRRRLEIYNRRLEANGKSPLRHGIGIHSGPVVAANIGSPDRLSYAMVGDTVNLASRIQDLNKKYQTDILISKSTRTRLTNGHALQKLSAAQIKGKSEPVEIFAVP